MELGEKTVCYLLGSVIVYLFTLFLAFDAGERQIVADCKKVSFFYKGDQIYECLPYKRGQMDALSSPTSPPR